MTATAWYGRAAHAHRFDRADAPLRGGQGRR
jgi:hypothetical protein